MKSQRPAALADMLTIMAAGTVEFTLGLIARLSPQAGGPPRRAGYGARRRHAKVGRVPPVQPQPILAAVDTRRDLPRGHHRRRRGGDGARRAAGHFRAGARDRFPRAAETVVGDRLDRFRRLGPPVFRAASRRTASVRRTERPAAHRPGHTRGPVVPHPGRDAWTSVSSWPTASSGRWPVRSPWSTRCTDSVTSTTATCWASSTAPKTLTAHWPSAPPPIGDEDPDFAGSCYVHVQKYVHDMSSWNSTVGHRAGAGDRPHQAGRHRTRRRRSSRPTAHIALNVITDDDGTELKIVRHNMPFGELGKSEYGTYFIGYSRTPQVTEQMLRQHVPRRPTRQHRSHPGLLHRGHRRTVLLPHRRLSRRPTAPARDSRQRGRNTGI